MPSLMEVLRPLRLRYIYLLILCDFNVVSTFKAAVYEHVVISPDNATKTFTRDEAFTWMSKNLDIYEEQVAKAASQVSNVLLIFFTHI